MNEEEKSERKILEWISHSTHALLRFFPGTCDEATQEVLRVRTERTLGQILLLSILLCVTLCVAVICVIVLFPGHKIVVKNAESPSYCDLLGNLQKSVEDFLVTFKSHWRNVDNSPLIAQEVRNFREK